MNTNKGYTVEGDVIIINRSMTELDLFVKKFLDVLKKHCDYLIVSGFVSISTGRVRGTEDIDILVPVMNITKFRKLFTDLLEGGFWCYQGDNADSVYDYIKNLQNIRFARDKEIFPNVEFVPINETKKAKFFEFSHPQKIRIDGLEFKIPPIEFEILYKEIVLGGDKDIADAKHLRTFFSDFVKKERFIEYEKIIRDDQKSK